MRDLEAYNPEAEYRADKKALLDEAKPHWVSAIIGLATAAASAYANSRQQAAGRRSARNAAALSNLPQGGATAGGFQPSALSSVAKGGGEDINKLGLSDLLKPKEEQKFTLGDNAFSQAGQAPQASDKDFHLFSGNEFQADLNKPTKPEQEPQQAAGTGLSTDDYLSLAQSAGSIASQLAQGPPAPPGFMPQPGPMNYQPTALAQLARRRGF